MRLYQRLLTALAVIRVVAAAVTTTRPEPAATTTDHTIIKPRHLPIPLEDNGRQHGCTGDQLNMTDARIARDKLVEWGRAHKIKNKTWHKEVHNKMAWWICNCKAFWEDPVEEDELQWVEDHLNYTCGPGMSGWVWSQQWNKGFNMALMESKSETACPEGCLFPAKDS